MSKDVDVYYGCYRGQVKQLLTNGFCKIAIPGILYPTDANGKLDVDALPPAECATPVDCTTKNNGTYAYPAVNTTVWCFFENGDVNRPIYFATSVPFNANWHSVANITQNGESNTLLKPVDSGKMRQVRFGRTTINQNDNSIKMQINSKQETFDKKNGNVKDVTDNDVEPGFAALINVGKDSYDSTINVKSNDSVIVNGGGIILQTIPIGRGPIHLEASDIYITASDSINLNAGKNINMSAPTIDITGVESATVTNGVRMTKTQQQEVEEVKAENEVNYEEVLKNLDLTYDKKIKK